jgi:hypothetical protein
MYIVDSGINIINDPDSYEPGTGVIWKVVNIKNDI